MKLRTRARVGAGGGPRGGGPAGGGGGGGRGGGGGARGPAGARMACRRSALRGRAGFRFRDETHHPFMLFLLTTERIGERWDAEVDASGCSACAASPGASLRPRDRSLLPLGTCAGSEVNQANSLISRSDSSTLLGLTFTYGRPHEIDLRPNWLGSLAILRLGDGTSSLGSDPPASSLPTDCFNFGALTFLLIAVES